MSNGVVMKKFFLFLFFPVAAFSQSPFISAFRLKPNDLELSRRAQPGTPFDKVGRKFAILGFESGSFEAWAYPLKLVRNCELSFFIGSSTEPIRASDIVRFISVTPEATTLTYTFQSFTVKAMYVTPVKEPGAFILLDVSTTEPLSIVCSFLPVLQPMWPGGIGGQSARWLEDIKAYQISEPTRRNTGYIGSPAASGMSYTPAHMLSDVPNQFKIEVKDPQSVVGKYIPIILAGGKGNRDSIKAIYKRLMENPEKYYRENVRHFRDLRDRTMQIETPSKELNLAFEWAKVAYDNLLVDNPDMGLGLVAGLGASGTGGRPGFGWFFSGDAYINSFSINSYGEFKTVRDALAFTQKWQREDGKMSHELTQAVSYVNWWKDYPYGYIHGDTSPFYVCAMEDYVKMSGDVGFAKQSWSSIKRAYEWSLATDENSDGLMDNKKAGLGALEYGPLTDIQSDVYAGAVWVRAASAMSFLSRAVADKEYERKAEATHAKASKAFEKFWDEKNQQYAYAFTAKGEHVDIVSPWSSVGLMWGLGSGERSARSLEKLNSSELTTDWGIRSISNKSKYYEALNYNYGAVWPFLTSWVATAQYRHGLALQGYNSLMASVRHTFDNSLGNVTEVFSGTHNIWPQEAVSHQGFCTAGVVLPLVRGMLGLEADATTKTIFFAPQVPPDWEHVAIRNYRVGSDSFTFEYWKEEKGSMLWVVQTQASKPYTIRFTQRMNQGSKVLRAFAREEKTGAQSTGTIKGSVATMEQSFVGSLTLEISHDPAVEILPPVIETATGAENKGLKIISTVWNINRLTVTVEGLSGTSYELPLLYDDHITNVQGAQREREKLKFTIPPGPINEFIRHTIVLTTK